MALDTNMRRSYSDSAIMKRSISDVVFMLGWQAIPELTMFGMNAIGKFSIANWPTTKVEFIEDEMRPFTSLLATALADTVTTSVVVTTDEGVYFRYGDIIKINDEPMFVSSVSGDTLTVVREYGGVTGSTHAQDDPIRIVTRAIEEGADHMTGHIPNTTQFFNYTQIISETVIVSKTRARTLQWGIEDEMDYQVSKLFADGGQAGYLARMLAQTFYDGVRVQRVDGVTNGSMGGFDTRLAEVPAENKLDLAGAALTDDHIQTIVSGIRENNGMPDLLICGAWGKRKLAALYKDTIRTQRDETIGGHTIEQIVTPLGDVSILYSWLCPEDSIYFVDRSRVGWFPLRPFEQTETAEYGDRYGREVVGEYTFGMVNPGSHGKISNMSTTS